MKEKIITILIEFSKPEKANYEQRVILDNDFEKLADFLSEKIDALKALAPTECKHNYKALYHGNESQTEEQVYQLDFQGIACVNCGKSQDI